jgi:hypothetical protein
VIDNVNWLAAMVSHCGVLSSSCLIFVQKHEAKAAQISGRLAFPIPLFSAVVGYEQLMSSFTSQPINGALQLHNTFSSSKK